MIGVISEPVFGPAITFGAVGVQVEKLTENSPMRGLVKKLGFSIHKNPEDMSVLFVTKPL